VGFLESSLETDNTKKKDSKGEEKEKIEGRAKEGKKKDRTLDNPGKKKKDAITTTTMQAL